jgi:hypothetical protein
MVHKIISIICVQLFFTAAAVAQATFPVERPVLKVGDTWSYQRTDLWTKQLRAGVSKATLKETTADKYIFEWTNFDGRKSEFATNFDLNRTYIVRGLEQIDQLFKWPLAENNKYTYKTLNTRDQWEWTYEPTCLVEGVETIKVIAGEFSTIKTICKGMWANTPGNGTGSGMNETIVWYAPSVKRGVKYQNKNWNNGRLDTQTSDELVEFKVN